MFRRPANVGFRPFLQFGTPHAIPAAWTGTVPDPPQEGKFEMHNVNSVASRVAAFVSAGAITALMLFAYFTPVASAPIGLIA
jgi:hypothetical protein